jgi:hypothetical protein
VDMSEADSGAGPFRSGERDEDEDAEGGGVGGIGLRRCGLADTELWNFGVRFAV